MRRALLSLTALLVAAGCDRDPTRPPVPTPELEPQTIAFLVMSDTLAEPGDEVTVVARARGITGIGSFTAQMRFDPARLEYLGAGSASGMRAINQREPGRLIVAGADPSGFSDDQLFDARFRVLAATPSVGMQLEISELVGTGFESLLPSLSVRGIVGSESGLR